MENWIHFCMETLVSGLGMFENGRKGTVSKDDCITHIQHIHIFDINVDSSPCLVLISCLKKKHEKTGFLLDRASKSVLRGQTVPPQKQREGPESLATQGKPAISKNFLEISGIH